MDPILSMRNISKYFFGIPANQNVSLEVGRGEIHALLGENGAGKTTLMNILYGLYTHDEGEIWWKGEHVSFRSPKDAIACKIGMVHQHFSLVSNLTVSENITLGLKCKGYPFTDRKYLKERLTEISDRYGLSIDPDAKISSLSVGEQQRVEIIKLLYRNAELLILDEPTAVLTPGEIKDFFRVLRRLREDGCSVIIITHRIPEVMEIADRVTVLRDSKAVFTGDTASLTETSLSEHMIGRQLKLMHRDVIEEERTPSLQLEHVTMRKKDKRMLTDVSLQIAPGEILGIAGVDGNGQKYLAEAILGIRKYQSGTISLAGQNLNGMGVSARKKMGIGYISDDRHHDGLVIDMSLTENMLLQAATCAKYVQRGFINRKAVRSATDEAIKKFSIKTPGASTPIRLLSGGNQQKLILARELYEGVQLIVAFQPTRGLDIGASEFIREQLLYYRQLGCCVLLISADLEEILSISDRVAVMHGGKIMGELVNDSNIDMSNLGLMMAGRSAETLVGKEEI